ncbi:MAG: D-aminoacylase [Caldilineaceae bacterium]|nr:D-aminoacylase [Caldilineaceae bacterium]
MLDLILRHGTVIDGSNSPRYEADVAVQGDRIVKIGRLAAEEARQTIDATGKIVAPGFVDVHNHSDGWLLKTPHLFSKTSQGFTSEVIMADGISYAPVNQQTAHEWIYYLRALDGLRFEEYSGWQSLGDYMALLDGTNVQNSIAHLPYANVRTLVCGFGQHAVDDYQLQQVRAEVERGLADGAVGLSTGLDYIAQCWATTDELVAACQPLAEIGGLYATHMRYKQGTLAALQEAVEIGRRAGVPVHISHLKGATPEETEELLNYIDTVAVNEVSFSFDVYPYMPGSTMLNYLLPYEAWTDGPLGVLGKLRDPALRARCARGMENDGVDFSGIHIAWVMSKENSIHQGKTLAEYIAAVKLSPVDALCNLLVEENLAVLLVFHQGADERVHPFLQHKCYMMGTDGIYQPDSVIHPRQYGSATRLLGSCVRDHNLFSLEEAVHKLSGLPAERFGLTQRGLVREGWFADLVVFDAAAVSDRATFQQPHQPSVGIEQVIVNGVPIIHSGQPVGNLPTPLPGRALKFK